MALLLDTNILIAIVNQKAGALDREMIDALPEDVDHVVSVASLWEIAIKNRLGKLPLPAPLFRLPEVIDLAGLKLLDINRRHVLADISPMPATRDPFDRLLLAQSAVEGLRLMTLDRALVDHPLAWRA